MERSWNCSQISWIPKCHVSFRQKILLGLKFGGRMAILPVTHRKGKVEEELECCGKAKVAGIEPCN